MQRGTQDSTGYCVSAALCYCTTALCHLLELISITVWSEVANFVLGTHMWICSVSHELFQEGLYMMSLGSLR